MRQEHFQHESKRVYASSSFSYMSMFTWSAVLISCLETRHSSDHINQWSGNHWDIILECACKSIGTCSRNVGIYRTPARRNYNEIARAMRPS